MHKNIYSERKICSLLNISRSTKYRRNNYIIPGSKVLKAKSINIIMQIWSESGKRYGAPKIKFLLQNKFQIYLTIRTVSKYMKEIRIQSVRAKKFKPGKQSKDKVKRPNLLHNLMVDTPLTHILTDITYIYTPDDGWVYFLSFMDIVTRKILMWDISKTMDSNFVNALLIKLLNYYPNVKMIHSDQGSQYTSNSYTQILINNNIQISYSRKGYPYHNAWIESFHSTLKREQIYNLVLMNIDDVKLACFDFIEGFYNGIRIHESLGYKTPNDFERELLETKILKVPTTLISGIITFNGEIKEFAI